MHRHACIAALVFSLGILSGNCLSLTRDENDAYLKSVLSDPDAGFHSWALHHRRTYAAQLTTLLNSNLPSVLAQLGVTTEAVAAVPQYEIIANIIDSFVRSSDGEQRQFSLQADALGRHTMLGQVDMQLLQQHVLTYGRKKSQFLENAKYAAAYNDMHGDTHWLGLNSLADLSFDEYRTLLGTRQPQKQATSTSSSVTSKSGKPFQDPAPLGGAKIPGFMYGHVELSSLPRVMDWRNHSVVTPVKNQGMCGSCWAFTTTGAVEGINALYTKKLVSLSEQELVDCDRDVDMGCSGGMMNNAYEWIVSHSGLHTEDDWPYTAQESFLGCTLEDHEGGQVVTIDGFQEIPVGDEVSLLKAAAHQPVAVAVEADSRAFQLYMGGVMTDPGCGDQLNHGVLVVGYGGLDKHGQVPAPGTVPVDPTSGEGLSYWLIKNSWGEAWGAGGYIKIQMGYKNNQTGMQGLCGITLAASYPVKSHPNPKPQPKPEPTPGPGPKPSDPVRCDAIYACPPQSTCCCLDTQEGDPAIPFASNRLFGPVRSSSNDACGMWGCCPMADAVCCEDRLHCCPSTLPVCETDSGRCMPKDNANSFNIPWVYFTEPARKTLATPVAQPSLDMKQKTSSVRRYMRTRSANAE